MSFGLRVWDSSEVETVDLTTRLTRFVGVFELTGSAAWQFISVPEMTADGTWAAVVTRLEFSVRVTNGGFEVKGATSFPWPVSVLVFRV